MLDEEKRGHVSRRRAFRILPNAALELPCWEFAMPPSLDSRNPPGVCAVDPDLYHFTVVVESANGDFL